MELERYLEEAKATIEKIVPRDVEITEIDLEAAVVVVYTKNMERFAKNNELVKHIAQKLKRRVAIRPDPSTMLPVEETEEEIKKTIPEDAEITDIYFEPETGEVTIEVMSPGIAIGKHGSFLNDLKTKIGWAPKIVRAPPIPSKTVSEIREFLKTVHDERKDFLRSVGKKLLRSEIERRKGETPWLRMSCLGSYREVGRSGTLLMTPNSKILIDCGIMPSSHTMTPYLEIPEARDFSTIDAVVITHAHMDHCGLLPMLFKYGYNGPVYCTAPTRDMMALLLLDSLKLSVAEGGNPIFESQHIREAIKKTIPLKYGETTDIASDMRLTLQNAGHILGSSICHFHVGDGLYNVAFTGDMKFEKTWLFNPATNRFPRLEAMIIESTYGGYKSIQPKRSEASGQLKEILKRALNRGGKVIIPVFAVGRSQEVMLVIEDLMKNEMIPHANVYLDGMIWEATSIHAAYPEFLNSSLRTQIFQMGDNPFLSDIFKRVDSHDMRLKIIGDPEPCIVLATAGMMNGGPVLEYFKAWGGDSKSSLVFVGYQVEGTLGNKIQKGWKEVILNEKGAELPIKVNLDVETCDGFSGHSDRVQLMKYIESLDPRPGKIIINHGEEHKSLDLASSLYKKFGIETRVPFNLETIRFK